MQHVASFGFGFPTAHFSKGSFQFAGADTVFVAEVFLSVDSFFFFHNVIEFLVAHHHGLDNGEVFETIVVLAEDR